MAVEQSHVFSLPLVRLGTGLGVQSLSSEVLNGHNIKVYCFLHHLN